MGRYVPLHKSGRKMHPVAKPFYLAEEHLEAVLDWLKSLALLEILGILGNIGILIAISTYVGSEKQRRDAEVLNAWQTLTSAHGQPGNGGRKRALEFLNASPGANWRRKFPWACAPNPICTWPPESLDGVNLSALSEDNNTPGGQRVSPDKDQPSKPPSSVNLSRIKLPKASLVRANLSNAFLRDAFLRDANLHDADLSNTFLGDADLSNAFLFNTDLRDANLRDADLSNAILINIDLRSTKAFAQAQIEGDDPPFICNTLLPEGVKIDRDRDCKILAEVLQERYPSRFKSLEQAQEFVNQQRQKKLH